MPASADSSDSRNGRRSSIRASRSGAKTSSASRIASTSPVAAAIAVLRAPASPRFSCRISVIAPANGASTSGVASVEPSSQTITPSGGPVCSSAERTASATQAAA